MDSPDEVPSAPVSAETVVEQDLHAFIKGIFKRSLAPCHWGANWIAGLQFRETALS